MRIEGLVASAVLAWCLQSPCPAADAALIAAAKTEGRVVWYTTLIVNQAVRPLAKAFEEKYPGIEVRYSRADSGPTALKILNEARAARLQADVFDGTGTAPPLVRAGLVAAYLPPTAAHYPPELRDPEGHWICTNLYFLTPGINTSLVPRDAAPRTLQDLLDPKWRGRIAWSSNPTAGAGTFIGTVLRRSSLTTKTETSTSGSCWRRKRGRSSLTGCRPGRLRRASAAINCIGTLAVVSHCDAQDGKGRNPFGLTF
jgi:ABC-type thiamine transport system substrate-binding protein